VLPWSRSRTYARRGFPTPALASAGDTPAWLPADDLRLILGYRCVAQTLGESVRLVHPLMRGPVASPVLIAGGGEA